MGIKNKITQALIASATTLLFYLPAYAQQTPEKETITVNAEKETVKEEKKNFEILLKDPNVYQEKKEGKKDDLVLKFKYEFDKRFETEINKRNAMPDCMSLSILDQQYQLNGIDKNLKLREKVNKDLKKSSQEAVMKSLEIVIKETPIWDEVIERFKWIGQMAITKNKGKKAEVTDTIGKLKNPVRSEEEIVEDNIDQLEEDIKDLKRAGDLIKAEELERQRDNEKRKLYQKRKFKLSFGVGVDYDVFEKDDFGLKASTKLKSKYADSKLSYKTKDHTFQLDFDREIIKDLNVSVSNTYQMKENKEKGTGHGPNSVLSLNYNLQKYAALSVSHTRNWEASSDATGISLSKTFEKGPTVSVGSNYNWKNKGVGANLEIKFVF